MHMLVVCGEVLWVLLCLTTWRRSRQQNAAMSQLRSDQVDLRDEVDDLKGRMRTVREIVDQLSDTRSAPAAPLQRARHELAVVTPIRTRAASGPRHLRKEPVTR
jgi:cell division protein FtsB